jgi:hypothetical protein
MGRFDDSLQERALTAILFFARLAGLARTVTPEEYGVLHWEFTGTRTPRWRREYGGVRVDQARRLKDLERENMRLKRVVADHALDIAILKEAASGNF